MSASCSLSTGSALQPRLGRHTFSPIACSRSLSGRASSVAGRQGLAPAVLGCAAAARSSVCCSSAAASAAYALPSDASVPAAPSHAEPLLQPTARLVAAIVQFVLSVAARARNAVTAAFPQMKDVKPEDVRRQLIQLKQLTSNIRLLAFVAPLAKAAASESLTAVYTRTFERAAFGFAKMYLFCLFMRVLLSWFPSIDWNAQPWTFLRLITEPYLQIYRGILPPLFGQLDFTPLFGFLILQDVVEVMAPTYTMGMHFHDTSTRWTTSDVMCYFDGF